MDAALRDFAATLDVVIDDLRSSNRPLGLLELLRVELTPFDEIAEIPTRLRTGLQEELHRLLGSYPLPGVIEGLLDSL